MKAKLFAYCLLPIAYFISSCGSGNKTNSEREKMISQIDSIGKIMFDKKNMTLDKNLADKGILAYKDFVAKYPDDSLSAE